MEQTDFEKWLRLGLGRAILFLQQNASTSYRDAILYSCLHDQRHERQGEYVRGRYLYDVVMASGYPIYYRDKIIASLYSLPEEGENAFQLLEIVRYFAATGDLIAHDALYSSFLKNAQQRDYRGGGELIALDGINGFQTVMMTYLQTVGEDEDIDDVKSWVYDLEEKEGDEVAQELLKGLSAQNAEVGERLASVVAERSTVRTQSKSQAVALDYQTLKQLLDDYCSKPQDSRVLASASRFRYFGKRATKEALAQFASLISEEVEPIRLVPMLRLFAQSTFPNDPTPLISLARHDDDMVARAAMQALERVAHPDVRQFALDLLNPPRFYWHAVDILSANFQDGDYALIEPLLHQKMNDDEYHWLGMGVRRMVEKYPCAEAAPSLLLLYENGPCGLCRGGFVELLDQLNALPDALRQECPYDSYPHTRQWIAEQAASLPKPKAEVS